MNKPSTRNDLAAAVPKFCFGLEVHRRTPEGRVRTAQEFLAHFFPYDSRASNDRIFRLMPNDVRAPILTGWGVRGRKSAFRDDEKKVQSVVHDALVAGDVDAAMFETAFAPDVLMRWIELPDWWAFWRAGKITTVTLLKALESAYELALFDADWFLDTLRGNGGKLRGTDVLAEGLSKADLTEWVRNIHQTQDGTAKGIIAALGWDQIVAKTPDEVLLAVLDSLADKLGLATMAESETKAEAGAERKSEPKVEARVEPKTVEPKPAEAKPVEPKVEAKPVEAKPQVAAVTGRESSHDLKPEVKQEPKRSESRMDFKVVSIPSPSGAPPASVAPKPRTDGPVVKPILVPSNAMQDEQKPLAFEDELIPISTPGWEGDEGEDPDGEGVETSVPRAARRSKPPPGTKRPSRNPPGK